MKIEIFSTKNMKDQENRKKKKIEKFKDQNGKKINRHQNGTANSEQSFNLSFE
jgi:hypothetical protein